MNTTKTQRGRPPLTNHQIHARKDEILSKLEPYLKSGLSLNKALRETKIANSEFYKYLNEDELFGEEVSKFKQYISVLVQTAIFRELLYIVHSQSHKSYECTNEERQFIMNFALRSNLTKEEFGRLQKNSDINPEQEIQKLKYILQNK
jgi:hypothetical protein